MSKRPTGVLNAQKKKILKEKFKYKLVRVTPEFEVEDLTPAQLDVFERRHPTIAARWIHGEDAPVSWQQQCQRILKGLMSGKIAAPFTAPVDPVKLNLPTYFQIVKKPMDLGTVSRHLSGNFYHSPEEFRAEVHRTFDNAMLFNPPGNLVHEDARRLKTTFDRKFSQVHVPSAPGGDEWGEGGVAEVAIGGGVGLELPPDSASAGTADALGEMSAADAAAAAVQSEMEAFAMEMEPENALRPVLSESDSDADSEKDDTGPALPAADAGPGGSSALGGGDGKAGAGTSAEGAAAGETNGVGGKQPATGGKQPVGWSGVPATGGKQPVGASALPATGGKQPVGSGGQPATGGKQPAGGGAAPSRGGKQPAAGKRPAMGGKGAGSMDDDEDGSVAGESEIADSEMDASENASEADASEVGVSEGGDADEQVSESDLFDDDDDEADYAGGDDLGSEMQSELGDAADSSLGDGGDVPLGNGASGDVSYPPSEADDSEVGEAEDDFAFGDGAG